MVCDEAFIERIQKMLEGTGEVRARKMFGDWLVYVDRKPVVLACDNRAFVKKLPAVADLLRGSGCGIPYEGAKEHYVLDLRRPALVRSVVRALMEAVPARKKE